jgi:hypothetical protein
MDMKPIIIENPIRTPEEMAEILGVSLDRVEAVRRIMNAPVRREKSAVAGKTVGTSSRKKSSPSEGRAAKKQ